VALVLFFMFAVRGRLKKSVSVCVQKLKVFSRHSSRLSTWTSEVGLTRKVFSSTKYLCVIDACISKTHPIV
jgi:hypothetical protein